MDPGPRPQVIIGVVSAAFTQPHPVFSILEWEKDGVISMVLYTSAFVGMGHRLLFLHAQRCLVVYMVCSISSWEESPPCQQP